MTHRLKTRKRSRRIDWRTRWQVWLAFLRSKQQKLQRDQKLLSWLLLVLLLILDGACTYRKFHFVENGYPAPDRQCGQKKSDDNNSGGSDPSTVVVPLDHLELRPAFGHYRTDIVNGPIFIVYSTIFNTTGCAKMH